LAKHPSVDVLPILPWGGYSAWLEAARFDIGLAPHLAGGPFNRARSASKLGEYAATGAAVIASHRWPAAKEAARAGRCLTVAGGPGAWIDAVERLAAWPARRCALAAENRRALVAADAAKEQRAVWSRILDIDIDIDVGGGAAS
jgi:hypothetical protein